MCVYLLAAEGGEKHVREERVKNSVLELEGDPARQRNFLRLEPSPVVTYEVDKDKGRVFDYGLKNVDNEEVLTRHEKQYQLVIREPKATVSAPAHGKK